jgi:hypothetical protein
MIKVRDRALALASALVWLRVSTGAAAVLQEDFSSDPATRGWQAFGESSAFHWNGSSQHLEVTWDSTRPNSYFHHPLGTVLTKEDDFSLSFDLRLLDVASGVVPGRTGPFEIAIGFLNLSQAVSPTFRRGTSFDSPNLVEFDYFPAGYYDDPVWGYFAVDPTVAATLISSNNEFATEFTKPLELTSNDWFHVTLSYAASNQTLTTILLHNGQPGAPVKSVVLPPAFSDFRVDTVSISSYSDAGDPYDSVLAHGWVDNLVATVPDPPVVAGGLDGGTWEVRLMSRIRWLYTLERTTNWTSWEDVSVPTEGTGLILRLQETNPAGTASAFYRVRAERP